MGGRSVSIPNRDYLKLQRNCIAGVAIANLACVSIPNRDYLKLQQNIAGLIAPPDLSFNP